MLPTETHFCCKDTREVKSEQMEKIFYEHENQKRTHTHTEEYHPAMRKEFLLLVTIQVSLKDIMLSKMSLTEKQILYYIIGRENLKKAEHKETENIVVVVRGWWVGKMGRYIFVKGCKLSVIMEINSGDLMYSMMILLNNAVLQT